MNANCRLHGAGEKQARNYAADCVARASCP